MNQEIDGKEKSKETEDGIVVPPGCDYAMLHQCGETVTTYTPSGYRPYEEGMLPHPMHGKTGGLSVPKELAGRARQSMTDYLNQFSGATICLDLWIDGRCKIKKCGTLLEAGADFLAMREGRNTGITLIDLKPVRYINIYCK